MIVNSMGITGPSVTPAIVGNPSPMTPGVLQGVSSSQANFSSSIFSAAKAVFSTFSFGATNIATKAAVGTTNQATWEAAKIKGQVGKVYYGAVASAGNAVAQAGTVAKNVAVSVSWISAAVVLVIGLFLLSTYKGATR